MPRSQFVKGCRFEWNGQAYIAEEELAENKLLIKNLTFGGTVPVTRAELESEWAKSKLRFAVSGKNTVPSTGAPQMREYATPDLAALSGAQREEAIRRYNLILPLLKLDATKRTDEYLERYFHSLITRARGGAISQEMSRDERTVGKGRKKGTGTGKALSVRSLRRWLRYYQESGGDIRSLAPASHQQGGKGKARLDTEVEEHILGVVEWCRANPANPKRTLEDVCDMVYQRVSGDNQYRSESNVMPMPSQSTLYRRLDSLGAHDILRRKLSILEAQARAGVMPGPLMTRVLEAVEYDVSPLDFIVVSDRDRLPLGRPVVCVGRDKFSGMPHGLSVGFTHESYVLIMSALYYGIMPKDHVQTFYGTRNGWPVRGLPEKLVTDNGPGFNNRALSDACSWLGIHWERTQREKAWFKGGIENFIKQHNRNFVHKVPGSVFSNILEKGDYDSIENACVTLSTFMKMLHIWLIDVYMQKWHYLSSTIFGGIPARLWEESVRAGFQPMWHDDAERVRVWLLPPQMRKLSRHGIHHEHLLYQSVALIALRDDLMARRFIAPDKDASSLNEPGENVAVLFKHDPNDLSYIYVLDPRDRKTWLRVPCTRPDYATGMDMWTHKLLAKFSGLKKAKTVDVEALVAARATLKKLAEQELQLTKVQKVRTRTQAARVLGLDRGSAPGLLPSGPGNLATGAGLAAGASENDATFHSPLTHRSEGADGQRTIREKGVSGSTPESRVQNITLLDANNAPVPLDAIAFDTRYASRNTGEIASTTDAEDASGAPPDIKQLHKSKRPRSTRRKGTVGASRKSNVAGSTLDESSVDASRANADSDAPPQAVPDDDESDVPGWGGGYALPIRRRDRDGEF